MASLKEACAAETLQPLTAEMTRDVLHSLPEAGSAERSVFVSAVSFCAACPAASQIPASRTPDPQTAYVLPIAVSGTHGT